VGRRREVEAVAPAAAAAAGERERKREARLMIPYWREYISYTWTHIYTNRYILQL